MGVLKKIADLQQEVPVIYKSTEGFGYNFADLTAIFNIVNPFMQKHGLGFTQGTKIHDTGGTIVFTKIFTKSDEKDYVQSEMLIPAEISLSKMNTFQVLGSGITYFKRYQISAMLGLITDEDTDAATANNMRSKTQKAKALTDKPSLKNLTKKVADYLVEKAINGEVEKVEKALPLYVESENTAMVIEALASYKASKDKDNDKG